MCLYIKRTLLLNGEVFKSTGKKMNETIQKEIMFLENLLATMYFKFFCLYYKKLSKVAFLEELNWRLGNIVYIYSYSVYSPTGLIRLYLENKYKNHLPQTYTALTLDEFKKSIIRMIVLDEYNKAFVLNQKENDRPRNI